MSNSKLLLEKAYQGNAKLAHGVLDTLSFIQVLNFTEQEHQSMMRGIPSGVKEGSFDKFDLKGLVYVDGVSQLPKEEVLELANAFEEYDFVEYAELEPITKTPPPAMHSTPNYISEQDYLPGHVSGDIYGIDVEYAWSQGVTGAGVKLADIEWGMDYLHEDLTANNFIEIISTTDHTYDDHGTAVVGIIAAHDNGFGMKGAMHDIDTVFGLSEIRYGRTYAISHSLSYLDSRDVLVLEMQTGAQNGNFVPADWSQSVWNLINTATAAGIIVVAAAGNGNENLDDSYYDAYRARGDHKGITVGAGTRNGRNKASFSTYGSPVHVQGWGDWTVATTGYGALYNGGSHATYTNSFSGTSSATPIVASAIVALQSYAKEQYNTILTPLEMRNLLISTGRAQGSGGHIGPLPNIEAAMNQLDATLITSACDDCNLAAKYGVKVYPNPTTDKVTIEGVEEPYVQLYNVHGRLLYEGYTQTVEMSAYTSGLYQFIVVKDDKQIEFRVIRE